eukprot:g24474.t1
MLSDDADLCDEVLHTVARAFRAWQQALVQAKKIRLESAEPQEPQAPREEPRASVAKLLGSEGYRQLGVGRRSFRSPRLSQEAPVEAEVGRTTEIESSPQAEQIEAASQLGSTPTAFRRLARKRHPDKGGSKEEFQGLRAAYELLSTAGVLEDLGSTPANRPAPMPPAASPFAKMWAEAQRLSAQERAARKAQAAQRALMNGTERVREASAVRNL